MSPPEKAKGPAADRAPNTPTITTTDSSRTDNASTFGAALDMLPLSTSRRCEGAYCWCHVGAEILWPLSHDDEMQRMFREIRSLDLAGGVLGI